MLVLPDYQSLGIGTKLNEFIAKMYVDNGDKFYIRTTHLRMIEHLRNNKLWIESVTSGRQLTEKDMKRIREHANIVSGDTRCAASFEYLGEDYYNKPKMYVKYDGDNVNGFVDYIKRIKENNYVVVVSGKPKEENPIELAMHQLGVRTELKYFNLKGELNETRKFKNLPSWSE